MPDRQPFEVELSRASRRDIASIARWSLAQFGVAAYLRYEALIFQALRDLASDPERPGSKARPDLMIPEARTYPLSFTRSRVPGTAVKHPRHFILYRVSAPWTIEIGRILHDSRNLAYHLPAAYKRT